MADKGIIYYKDKEGEKFYGLLPLIPGVFEFPFMKGGGTPMHKRLGQLWEEYHHEALGASFAGQPTPLMRVVAVEKAITAARPCTSLRRGQKFHQRRKLHRVDKVCLQSQRGQLRQTERSMSHLW